MIGLPVHDKTPAAGCPADGRPGCPRSGPSLLQAFNGMSVQPRLVLKEPAKGDRYLQVLIPLRSRRYRARVPEHLTTQLSELSDAVALLEQRHSIGLGHDAPPKDQARALPNSLSPNDAEDGAVMG